MAVATLLAPVDAAAQVTQDFSFANTVSSNVSSTTISGCSNGLGVTVTTTDFSNPGAPVPHTLGTGIPTAPNNSLWIPELSTGPWTDILVTITFTAPVTKFRLAVTELDQFGGSGTGPERLTGFSTGFISGAVVPYPFTSGTGATGPWPTFTESGGIISPTGDNNSGWLVWEGCHQSFSFRYLRPTDLGMLLAEMQFECECPPCGNCTCPTRVNVLSAETTPNEFGQLSAHLEILSGGNPISQVNISLPWYAMVAPAECIDCHANDITMNGHIYTALPLQGVNPTFVGPPGVGQSAEVTYCFDGSAEVNDNVPLKLQFPAVLQLECCKPDVQYCLKVEVIDKDCRYCEFLFCFPSHDVGGGGGKSLAPPAVPPANRPMKAALLVFPNPTTGRMQATLPLSHATRAYTVHDKGGKQVMNGTANGTQLDLDVSALGNGQYVLSLGSGDDRLEAPFVLQR